MSKTTVGYIVTYRGMAMWEESRKSAADDAIGVLYLGREATVFPNRRAAERAIERTKTYADQYGLMWSRDYWICRLEPSRG